jgi:hypothetical protein
MSKRKQIDQEHWSEYLGEVAREKRGWPVGGGESLVATKCSPNR